MEDMKKFLPEVDLSKLRTVLDIKNSYNHGTLSLEDARKLLKEKVVVLKPYEIALAEQELKEVEENECRKEDIQRMLELFDGIMDTSRPDLPPDHPVMCYYRENDELRKILSSIEELVQYPLVKNQWLALYDRLASYRLHLSRKQNQLYPVLERKGFDRPTTTMWLLDDFVRDEIKDARTLLENDDDERFLACQQTIVRDMRDLIDKEENVLYPTSLAMISPEEFKEMKFGDHEIGFAWIEEEEGRQNSFSVLSGMRKEEMSGFAAELTGLLDKYGYGKNAGNGLMDVATGRLSLEQINLIYRHLPVDLSYVDENELVCFYSDTKHRVFPRSRNVIGRNVKNCHPRSSVHVVEDIIEKFRSGERDHAEFWINKPGLFIYIRYVAVRDEDGKFRGVLEMMQDCTHIRSLEGSRTLLTWDEEGTPDRIPPSLPDKSGAEPAEMEITPSTLLKDLLAAYPLLKDRMEEISPKFKLLRSPLARVMLPKATVSMMAERTGIPVDTLVESLKSKIEKLSQ